MDVFNSTGIQALMVMVASLLLIYVMIKLVLKSDKGNVREAANTGGVVFIASLIGALGITGGYLALGQGALTTLFSF